MDSPRRYCRKCLLRDMPEADFFQSLQAYIAHIPQERKVPEPVLQRRLEICRSCDELVNGMCRQCGCYVEMRAVMRVRACPNVPAKWEREEEEP